MKKLLFLIPILGVMVSCEIPFPSNQKVIVKETTSELNSQNDAKKVETTQKDNVKDIVKDWHLDNPQCSEYMMDLDYGVEHSLYVRMYDERPDIVDYNNNLDMYKTFTIDHYIVYSRWRGDVYAYDKESKKYFLVWTESMNYNTKMVEDIGNGWIRLIYIDAFDINDMTDAVVYNLNTHKYYYEKIHNKYYEDGW